MISDFDRDDVGHGPGPKAHTRRKVLECMTWSGTGVLWSIAGGVPYSLGLVGEAVAQGTDKATGAGRLTFLQISDGHMGFAKPVNPNVKGTLEEAIGRIAAMPIRPSFMIHTGDITHLSKASEFDDAAQIISQARLDTHYVPGEPDILDPDVTLYRDPYGRGTRGAGWYTFDAGGVHFMGLVNVASGGRFMSLVKRRRSRRDGRLPDVAAAAVRTAFIGRVAHSARAAPKGLAECARMRERPRMHANVTH